MSVIINIVNRIPDITVETTSNCTNLNRVSNNKHFKYHHVVLSSFGQTNQLTKAYSVFCLIQERCKITLVNICHNCSMISIDNSCVVEVAWLPFLSFRFPCGVVDGGDEARLILLRDRQLWQSTKCKQSWRRTVASLRLTFWKRMTWISGRFLCRCSVYGSLVIPNK